MPTRGRRAALRGRPFGLGRRCGSPIAAARAAQPAWAARTPVERGDVVRAIAELLRERREEASAIVAEEGGKSLALARGETDAAIEMGFFVAGEGRRSYGRTTTASMPHRTVLTLRRPVGVAALIISFNTPLPNVAWKAFPSILCGNASVLKPSEETPASALFFATLALEAGLPPGVLNVIQGLGPEAGQPLVESPDVDLVSFTGSAATGRLVAERAGARLAKTCLELGGKNALVVCDDADLETAVRWTLASAFSNAGQSCAAASRIVVLEGIYDRFRERVEAETRKLTVGTRDEDFLGPVISERSRARILAAVTAARDAGATVVCGGEPVGDSGFGVAPTLLEGVAADAPLSQEELFGPVAILYRVADLDEAIELVDATPYGLTAAIHTASVHRAMTFAERVSAGVVVVNAGTHGSEPHMGFGGVKASGTGWKEAGSRGARCLFRDPLREHRRRSCARVSSALRPLAILGLGGVGGMLAARTGALCVGTPRSVRAIRDQRHPARSPRGDDGHAGRGGRAARGAGRSARHRRQGAGTRGRARPHCPAALDGAVVLPLLNGLEHVERIRARTGARRRRGQHRQARGHVARAGARRADDAGRGHHRRLGGARGRQRSERRSSRSPSPRIELVVEADERAVLWDKSARMAVLAAATVASGAIDRVAQSRPSVARSGSARRWPRRAASLAPTAPPSIRPSSGRSSRRCRRS